MQVNPTPSAQPDRLLRLAQVEVMVGLRKSSIYDRMARHEFPLPVRLSRRCVCWPESKIQQWIKDHITAGGL